MRCLLPIFALCLLALGSLPEDGTAGAVTGPRRWKRKILKGQEVVYKIQFRGGQPAEFAFIGDGSTDLDLYITDERGNKVNGGFDDKGRPTRDGRDFFPTDIAVIRWIPPRTQTYIIRVRPYTAGENEVYFGHN